MISWNLNLVEGNLFFLRDITRPEGPADKMDLSCAPSAANMTAKRSLISWEINEEESGPLRGAAFLSGHLSLCCDM